MIMYYDNKKLALSIFWLVLGVVLLGLSFIGKLDSSAYSGIGAVLMVIGICRIIAIIRYRRDPGYKEMVDTKINDERNRFLRMKSWSWTGYIVVLGGAVGSVIAMFMGQETLQIMLGWMVCVIMLLYWIIYMVLSRKY